MSGIKNITIGILALQGDFFEHAQVLRNLGVKNKYIKTADDLKNINGLIIPGGESTVMARLLKLTGLDKKIVFLAKRGLPIWGTCAGLILLSNRVRGGNFRPLRLLPISVNRNSYGRQINSFSEPLVVPVLGQKSMYAVYIRAPQITNTNKNVIVLARRLNKQAVAVQYQNILGTAFHPELTADSRFHGYFLALVRKNAS
ncbi:MAG: pyridoxal 5'-phosphate synthase glutaminase subunit PdxT [Candidatus Magasanikbacteria bacterium]|nr:pyridoxal 5'-phosphate synthase glutaminase subunit PdxT [Candidatus Magasanikbacteria bacterium]